MRLAISNIAWEVAQDEELVRLLKRYAVDAIDIAPGKYFPAPASATADEIAQVKDWWSSRGIELTGMQSLLFGTTGLNVFGDERVQGRMLDHLGAVCRIAGALGATRLVFGSPKNRDRSGLDDAQALDIATGFFRRLGERARDAGVLICLEPNPPCYGANFMTSSADTAAVVRAVAHPAIRMQFDTGALAINGEDPERVLDASADLIGHVHASEPNLVPLGDGATDHRRMRAALERHLPGHLVSIEMVATRDEPHMVSVERALARAVTCYQQPLSGHQ
jgi:sugar phosphate isomerase/epimerase